MCKKNKNKRVPSSVRSARFVPIVGWLYTVLIFWKTKTSVFPVLLGPAATGYHLKTWSSWNIFDCCIESECQSPTYFVTGANSIVAWAASKGGWPVWWGVYSARIQVARLSNPNVLFSALLVCSYLFIELSSGSQLGLDSGMWDCQTLRGCAFLVDVCLMFDEESTRLGFRYERMSNPNVFSIENLFLSIHWRKNRHGQWVLGLIWSDCFAFI